MEPKAGDFFVARTEGAIPRMIRYITCSRVNHAGIYIGGGIVVETKPGGIRYSSLNLYRNAIWSTDRLPGELIPTVEQRRLIVDNCRALIGIPYGMLDVVAIALAQSRLGNRVKQDRPLHEQSWFVKRVAMKTKLICSEFVDFVYKESGIHLFNDGRIESLVSPQDLLGLLT
jgi:hypothetical protein